VQSRKQLLIEEAVDDAFISFIFFSFEHPRKRLPKLVALYMFNAGTDSRFEQYWNIEPMVATFCVSKEGTEVKLVQLENILPVFVTLLVLNGGTSVRAEQ
jgi:hypothetical protein